MAWLRNKGVRIIEVLLYSSSILPFHSTAILLPFYCYSTFTLQKHFHLSSYCKQVLFASWHYPILGTNELPCTRGDFPPPSPPLIEMANQYLFDVSDPVSDVLECSLVGHIVHQHDALKKCVHTLWCVYYYTLVSNNFPIDNVTTMVMTTTLDLQSSINMLRLHC